MQKLDKLDFRLQSAESSLIATILFNNLPLYDSIICKHAELSFDKNFDKNNFFAESYSFEINPVEDLDEEILFYYNFPDNLMPVDCKHPMIGFSPVETFAISYQPFLESNELNFSSTELSEIRYSLQDFNLDNGLICLVHTCQSINCSNLSMKLELDNERKRILMHFFRDSFDTEFHKDVKFVFEKDQFLEILKRLNQLCKNVKSHDDYRKFLSERFDIENIDLFNKK